MKVGYDIMLSQRVKELLDEGTLTQLLAQVQSDLEGEWLRTPPDGAADRELIYQELHALNRVNIKISTLVNDLMMAERGETDGY